MKKEYQDKIIIYLRSLFMRVLVLAVIFLGLAILCKKNINYKNLIVSYIYEDNISFAKMKSIYNKYLGDVNPFDKNSNNSVPVFNENLEYLDASKYLDGGKLEVYDNYLIPSINEGMVIFIGKKDGYNNVLIISGIDGINYWYGNIDNTSLKLYDYVNKGDYVGMAKDNYLYLVCSSDNNFINYEECLL